MRSSTSESICPAWRAVAAACCLLIVAASAAAAQDQDVMLELRSRGGQMVTLALPRPTTGPGTEEHTRLLYEVLWDDLHHSMAFEMVDPGRYPPAGAEGTIPWERWRATGAQALIRTSVEMQGDRIYVEFRLFDVLTGEQRTGKRYTQVIGGLEPAEAAYQMRMVAHRFNDEAVLYYTGVAGVASNHIVFSSNRPFAASSPPDPRKELFLMDYDGERQRQITFDRSIALSPSFSPQGDRMVYQTYRAHAGVPNTELYMIRKTGGAPQPVLTCKGTTTGPAFSPDGTRIAVSTSCGGNPEIRTIRPDGTDMVQLTRNPGADVSPSWSPNGRQIAFISDRSGAAQMYVMDATGLNTRRLSAGGGQKDDPAWQPVRGELIAYTASTGGNNFDIFVYDLQTDRSFQLTRGSGRKEAPAWSPDGRQIAFEWARSDSVQIWVMGLDGSRQRMLTIAGDNLTPSWGIRP